MADSVITLRPDGTVQSTGGVVGATTYHGALSDDADGSYVQLSGGGGVTSISTSDITTALVGSAIRGIRARFRVGNDGGGRVRERLLPGGSVTQGATGAYQNTSTSTIQTKTGLTYAERGGGGPWTQADIDTMRVTMQTDLANRVNVYEVWVDVFYNSAPTVTVTSPTGTVTNTSRPPVVHTYSDPEGDVQERKRVKIFSAAQYGAGGFNPETSTATWDSGEVFSSTTSTTPAVDLVNSTTYKGYVKASDAGSGGRYSTWAAGPTFTMELGPVIPPVPTLSAVAEAGRIALTARSTGAPNVEFMRFEYLENAVWVTARGGERVPASSGVDVVLYDYEAPPGTSRSYRATAGRVNSGSDVFSAPSTTASATPAALTAARIFDPLDPGTTPATLTIRPTGGNTRVLSSTERRGDFEILGRAEKVTVADVVGAEEFELPLSFAAEADYLAFEAMRKRQRTLLLQDSLGQRYVRLGAVRTTTLLRTQAVWRDVDISASDRARP